MGISTLQSYRGAQIFEAIGLDKDFVERYFTHTASRIGGVGIDAIAEEARARHDARVSGASRWPTATSTTAASISGGATASSTCSTRTPSPSCNTRREADNSRSPRNTRRRSTNRRASAHAARPVRAEAAADADSARRSRAGREILKRFATGAMSYGSISQEAHETLAIAMNRIGGKSNTGEGGEDPARYVPDANGDSRRSAIKQVASARFGVTSEYLVNADELQIKMAQGAKPGEGGQLPGHKVYPWIAKVRHATPGVGLDFAAAAPRYLFDRRSRPADPRLEERQSAARAFTSSWWRKSASAPSPRASRRRTPTSC